MNPLMPSIQYVMYICWQRKTCYSWAELPYTYEYMLLYVSFAKFSFTQSHYVKKSFLYERNENWECVLFLLYGAIALGANCCAFPFCASAPTFALYIIYYININILIKELKSLQRAAAMGTAPTWKVSLWSPAFQNYWQKYGFQIWANGHQLFFGPRAKSTSIFAVPHWHNGSKSGGCAQLWKKSFRPLQCSKQCHRTADRKTQINGAKS